MNNINYEKTKTFLRDASKDFFGISYDEFDNFVSRNFDFFWTNANRISSIFCSLTPFLEKFDDTALDEKRRAWDVIFYQIDYSKFYSSEGNKNTYDRLFDLFYSTTELGINPYKIIYCNTILDGNFRRNEEYSKYKDINKFSRINQTLFKIFNDELLVEKDQVQPVLNQMYEKCSTLLSVPNVYDIENNFSCLYKYSVGRDFLFKREGIKKILANAPSVLTAINDKRDGKLKLTSSLDTLKNYGYKIADIEFANYKKGTKTDFKKDEFVSRWMYRIVTRKPSILLMETSKILSDKDVVDERVLAQENFEKDKVFATREINEIIDDYKKTYPFIAEFDKKTFYNNIDTKTWKFITSKKHEITSNFSDNLKSLFILSKEFWLGDKRIDFKDLNDYANKPLEHKEVDAEKIQNFILENPWIVAYDSDKFKDIKSSLLSSDSGLNSRVYFNTFLKQKLNAFDKNNNELEYNKILDQVGKKVNREDVEVSIFDFI